MSLGNFLSGAGQFLDGLIGVDSSDAEARSRAISDYIHSDAMTKASQPLNSTQGMALSNALLTQRPVAYHEPNAAANDAAVAAAKAHYENQFRDGGLQAGAAVQQAQLAGDLTSRGGAAGIRQDILDSAGRQQQVASIAQQERQQGGNAANALQASDAGAALKRAILAAQVSHANFTNAYNQDAALFGLKNTQDQLGNLVNSSTSDAQYQQAQLAIQQQAQQASLGQALLGSLLSGGSGLASTFMSQAAAKSGTNLTAGHVPATAASPGISLGNYMAPGIKAGADTAYTPIFNTPSATPIDPGYWSKT